MTEKFTLRDYQVECLEATVDARKRGVNKMVIAMSTGAGKTVIIANLPTYHSDALPMLVLAHREELLTQARDKILAVNPDLDVQIEMGSSKASTSADVVCASVASIGRSNSSRIETFPKDFFKTIVIDECFPAGTLVGGVPIEQIKPGDMVPSWDEKTNTLCLRPVTAIMENVSERLIKIHLESREDITCTPNHPFMTKRGWVSASDILVGEKLLSYDINSELHKLPTRIRSSERQEIPIQEKRQSLLFDSLQKRISEKIFLRDNGKNEQKIREFSDENKQSNVKSSNAYENATNFETHKPQTQTTRRKWPRLNRASEDSFRSVGLGYGNYNTNKRKTNRRKRLSISLQNRYSKLFKKNSYRSRWNVSLRFNSSSSRQKETRLADWKRVEGIEIQEPRNINGPGQGSRDYKVYNLEVADTHTYLVGSGIVVHNCHHSPASTYRNVLDYFTTDIRYGFTATPKRPDNVRLDDIFDEIVYEKNMLDLISEGYLSEPVSYRFNSEVDISEVSINSGDYAVGELSEAVNVEARHQVALDAYEYVKDIEGEDLSTIVFCVDVKHAESLAAFFNSKGYGSKAVSGQTENRDEIIAEHKAGKFPILTNCMIAVEGYDDPSIRAVIMARPARSSIYYAQAVGRGARLDGKANRFYVLDIADVTRGKRPLSILSLSGLPAEFVADGEELTNVVSEFNKLKETSPSSAVTVKSLDDIKAAWEKINIFTPPPFNEALLEYSRMLWMEVGDEYVLNADSDRYKILPNHMGTFVVQKNSEIIQNTKTLAEAFNIADSVIAKDHSDKSVLLDSQARWRDNPPTEKQVKILKKFNVPYEHLSKGEASQIIDKLFKDNPRPKRPAWLEAKISREKSNRKF